MVALLLLEKVVEHYMRFMLTYIVIINVDKVSLLLSCDVSQPIYTHASISKYIILGEGDSILGVLRNFKLSCQKILLGKLTSN
jgi:hypothetical protein